MVLRVVDEVERSVHDAMMAVKAVVEYPYVVVGGGAPEALVSLKLREWSGTLAGRLNWQLRNLQMVLKRYLLFWQKTQEWIHLIRKCSFVVEVTQAELGME